MLELIQVFKNTQIYFPILNGNFDFETDFVIDAQQAELLDTTCKRW